MNAAGELNGAELGARIATLAAELTVGEHALITAIGDFEESGQWAREGAVSCAHWLSWRIGMSPEASRERVRVAKALRTLPNIDAAFRSARLSYSKVRAVTRVATPDNDALLVEVARCSAAAQLESICRKFRGCLKEDATAAEARRRMSVRSTDHGTLRVSIELPADEGARLVAAVESGRAALAGEEERAADAPPTARIDGLMAVVESWFAGGPKPRRGGAPHEVILHVSAETLAGVSAETRDPLAAAQGPAASESTPFLDASGSRRVSAETRSPLAARHALALEASPCVDTAGGVGVSAETAQRLCCDASIAAVVEDGAGNVLDVGRKRRTVPAAMARALEAREGRGCSFPGCTHTLFVDKHHLKHWADGGATRLDNLCQLCRYHHTFVHEHGWRVERAPAGLRFITPRGRVVHASPELPSLTQGGLQALAADAGLELDEVSLQTEGWGDPVDYVMVIDALLRETFIDRAADRASAFATVSAEV